jgi:pimeloyl-ACP methyl ester carboxylesterase
MQTVPTAREGIRRSVTSAAGLAVTIIEPQHGWNGRVLYCLPGGGMSRQYFDLSASGYSMAKHLAGQGFASVLIDHPGVGESAAPDDPWTLTPHRVAAADAAAVAEVHARIGGIPIGIGHSMGAMLTVTLQGRHRAYAGIGLLGFAQIRDYGATDLAGHLSPEELLVLDDPVAVAEQLVALAQVRFSRALPRGTTASSPFLLAGMEVPDEALAAIDRCASNLIAVCGLGSMLKCARPEMSEIDVPVFVGFGERDITGDARDTANALPRCPDITLFELAAAGHNHNVAPNRRQLWDRLGQWALGVLDRGSGSPA